MSAGAPTPDPELDAEIAEQVMGWVRNRHGRLWPDKQCFGYKHSRGHGFIPPFSTDATAAMQVIEELAGDRFQTRLETLSNRDGEYACTLLTPGRRKSEFLMYSASAPWPARAICLAAIKLVESLSAGSKPGARRGAKKTPAIQKQAAAGQTQPAAKKGRSAS